MRTDTGHVVEDIETVPEPERKHYKPIPKRLEKAAKVALANKSETLVDIKGKSLLAKFAQKENKKTVVNKKKAVKASRKINRKK
jgi:hypothetical protein